MEEFFEHEIDYLIDAVNKDITEFKSFDIAFQRKYNGALLLYKEILQKLNKIKTIKNK
tara:strand:- start:1332 stop:1505 length:174 start_codon:yes stop_codon:yes gene_type:complete